MGGFAFAAPASPEAIDTIISQGGSVTTYGANAGPGAGYSVETFAGQAAAPTGPGAIVYTPANPTGSTVPEPATAASASGSPSDLDLLLAGAGVFLILILGVVAALRK
jgi:hypothetical protein